MIGKILGGRYELLELIGVGGMSRVYKAKCNLLNRFVAVKILKEEFNEDKEFIKRFYIESQAAASLSSPHIVSIYDVGDEENLHYIVMEYVEGVTLKDVIKENGVLAWNVALNLSMQILTALECAHKNGIVHRDIKPHNMIVTEDGVLKVTDFGIARAVNSNETKKIDSDVIGSVHYISPEQAKGIMIDARCDLYSLGIVMYEMLTGKLPYDGENPVSVALMHLSSEPVSIKELNITVPNELVRIVTKSMQRDVLNRYQNAKEMVADLTEFKKVENLTTKENEDAVVAEVIELVKAAKKEEAPVEVVEEQTLEHKGMDRGEVEIPVRLSNRKAQLDKKQEKIAMWSAIGVSTAVVVAIVLIFLKVLFPGFNFASVSKAEEYLLPNVVGKNIDEVRSELEDNGLTVIVHEVEDDSKEDGTILRQTPGGNIRVKVKKTKVELDVVSNESDEVKVEVPNVSNKEYRQAKQELEKAGFSVRIIEEESSEHEKGYVLKQNPAAKKSIPKGSEVVLYVAIDSEVTVPDFVGMTEAEATKKASECGLVITFVEKEGTEDIGKITQQSLAKDTKTERGTSVRLTITVEAATPSATPSPTPQAASKQSLTIDLPQDRETVTVVIKRGGSEVYHQSHQTSEKRVTVTVTGSGTEKIEITIDGQLFFSQNVKFN